MRTCEVDVLLSYAWLVFAGCDRGAWENRSYVTLGRDCRLRRVALQPLDCSVAHLPLQENWCDSNPSVLSVLSSELRTP